MNTKPIYVYDIDDTLLKSISRTMVKSGCGNHLLFYLTPMELNEYFARGSEITRINAYQYNEITKDGEHRILDCSQFTDLSIMKQGRIIKPIFKQFEKNYRNGKKVGIITARSSKQLVLDYFEFLGFPLDPELVYAINDPKFEHPSTNFAERKEACIKELHEKHGFNKIHFYDDDINNLELAFRMGERLGIKVKPFYVNEQHRSDDPDLDKE